MTTLVWFVGRGWGVHLIFFSKDLFLVYKRAFLVAVTTECCVKRVIRKTWTEFTARTLAKSADPDQTPQTAAVDLGSALFA